MFKSIIHYYIQAFFLILICSGCHHKKSTERITPQDSIPVAPQTIRDSAGNSAGTDTSFMVEFYDRLNATVTDTIQVRGLPFEINGLHCYWNYTVNLMARKIYPQYNARVISQSLTLLQNDSVIFIAATSPDDYLEYRSVADLKNNSQYTLEGTDLNKDGWLDYEVLIERAAAGANTTKDAYLFNPRNKSFERSGLFSGTNVEYDSAKNSITTFWKMSVDDYYYTHTYLKRNQREIAYQETEHHDGDTITYTKLVKGKVVKKRREIVKEGYR